MALNINEFKRWIKFLDSLIDEDNNVVFMKAYNEVMGTNLKAHGYGWIIDDSNNGIIIMVDYREETPLMVEYDISIPFEIIAIEDSEVVYKYVVNNFKEQVEKNLEFIKQKEREKEEYKEYLRLKEIYGKYE